MGQLKSKMKNAKHEQFKKIVHHLENYRIYKVGIVNLQKELDRIMPGITVSYEVMEGTVGAFCFKSKTEDYAIDRIESKRALQLHENIAVYKMIVESIDAALEYLDDKEREYVIYRYIDKQPVYKAAELMSYSDRQTLNIKKRVQEKLLTCLANIIHLEV